MKISSLRTCRCNKSAFFLYCIMRNLVLLGLFSVTVACTKTITSPPVTTTVVKTNTIYLDTNISVFKLCLSTWKLDSVSVNHAPQIKGTANYQETFTLDGQFNFSCPSYQPADQNYTYQLVGNVIKFKNQFTPEGAYDYIIVSLTNNALHYYITNNTNYYEDYYLTH